MTITISTTTLIVVALLLVILALTPLLYRLSHVEMSAQASEVADLPPLTVVITPHNEAQALERNLPALLNQEYAAGLRVIVVYWRGDSEVEDVLKRNAGNDRLYYTYIPETSRYMSREKLAITVGVKAATTEWVVLTTAHCHPDSTEWIENMARYMTDDRNMVLGATSLSPDTSVWRRFHHALTGSRLLHQAQKHTGWATNMPCLAFRKSEFIEQEGFRGNLKFARGEFEFIVNKYAKPHSVATAVGEGCWLEEDEPTDKEWQARRLFAINTRQQLGGGAMVRFASRSAACLMHLWWIVSIGAIVFGAATTDWLKAGAGAVSLIIGWILRSYFGGKQLEMMKANVESWRVPLLELGHSWGNLFWLLRYKRADKLDFITHKL